MLKIVKTLITLLRWLLAFAGLSILIFFCLGRIQGNNYLKPVGIFVSQVAGNVAGALDFVEVDQETVSEEKAIDLRPLVILDPGHGGVDGGTVAGRSLEKNLNLEVANLVALELKRKQVRVEFTRQSDRTIKLVDRAKIANVHPEALFVSIHHNASTNASPHGVETYYADSKSDSVMRAQRLYFELSEDVSFLDRRGQLLAKYVQEAFCFATGALDRGIRPRRLAMTRWVSCPAILVECGFLSNAEECAKLKSKEYRSQLSVGIAKGILNFLNEVEGDPYYGVEFENESVGVVETQSENSGS